MGISQDGFLVQIICVSLGGSGITTPVGLDLARAKKFINVLKKNRKFKFVIVVGGGRPARNYMQTLKGPNANDDFLDSVGIMFTRINAFAIKQLLPIFLNPYPNVAQNIVELKAAIKKYDIVLMGGLYPGITTDAVTAKACEALGSKLLINLSSEPYVHDRPPSQKGARKFTTMSHLQLLSLAKKYGGRKPGLNFIFDLSAAKIVMKRKIEVRFASYSPNSFAKAILGRQLGTTVK